MARKRTASRDLRVSPYAPPPRTDDLVLCHGCSAFLRQEMFYPSALRDSKYRCRPCTNRKNLAYARTHPFVALSWRLRARENDKSIRSQDVEAIFSHFGNTCFVTGAEGSANTPLTVIRCLKDAPLSFSNGVPCLRKVATQLGNLLPSSLRGAWIQRRPTLEGGPDSEQHSMEPGDGADVSARGSSLRAPGRCDG